MTAYEALAVDLLRRTESSIDAIAGLAVDTGITFTVDDIVQRVEDELPEGYPECTAGAMSRRDVVAEMARDLLSSAGNQE
ncbi:fibronectin-binding protein [Streptomyces sp. NBRC 110611]|uniref:hypothetical protein n=1 Tax=Streptomyces sp. NBRC 110611 TaxID=1621259 RepID=UPI0008306775|nr:hypothetical protein [Streptomyces sp. NBRC 110611]GAU70621.1 fibronectin-binding protein [Streptomyces sp. NBRC 110611]